MKNNFLPLIAHAHLATADDAYYGPKDGKCLKLAELHSQAVDYAKTGMPGRRDKKWNPRQWPHFMEKNQRTYRSHKVLGQLYDMVSQQGFKPSYDMPFDHRILKRYTLQPEILKTAKQIKTQYDTAMKRIMGNL